MREICLTKKNYCIFSKPFKSMYKWFIRTLFILLVFSMPKHAYGETHEEGFVVRGKVVDNAGRGIVGCTVLLLNPAKTDDYRAVSSDREGHFSFDGIPAGAWQLELSMVGYKSCKQEILLTEDHELGKILLEEDIEALDNAIITAEMMARFGDRKEYVLTAAEKRQFGSALKALEFLPKIILSDQSVSSMDGKAVKILINGVPSDSKDLSVIPPELIARIVYYDQPPVQYSNLGLGSVVNIILKRRTTGGSLGVNTLNAVTTGFGGNTLGFKYNFGNSQIGLTYDMRYRDFNDRRVDETLDYAVGNQMYHKDKTGLEGLFKMSEHLGELTFNNAKADNYLFSAKVSMKSLDYENVSAQEVSSHLNGTVFSGNGRDVNRYLRPSADLYFSKTLAERHNLMLNVVGTYYSTGYDYTYQEMAAGMTDFHTATHIETDKYSVIADAVYSYQLKKAQWITGVRYNWNENLQRHLTGGNKTETHDIYVYSGWTGMFGEKVSYNAALGFNEDIFTTTDRSRYRFPYFRPSLRLGYFLSRSSQLTFQYEVNTQTPAISELTNNPYYKDVSYVYVGNPELKPANAHDLTLTFFKGFTKTVVNATTEYVYSKDAIAPVFVNDGTRIVETFANLDGSQTVKGSLFIQWTPWKSNILRLRMQTQVIHACNSYKGNRWNYTSFLLIPMATLAYKDWGLEVFFQSPRTILSGNLLNYESSMMRCELTYRPVKDLTLGIAVRYPFYRYWEGRQEVVGTSVMTRKETEKVFNHSNMLYFTLIYNFSFGNKGVGADRKVHHEDTDSGILKRVK